MTPGMTGPDRDGHQLDELVAITQAALSSRRWPWFDPEEGETVLVPEAAGRGYWVGAPSVVAHEDGQRALLSYRRRRPRGPRRIPNCAAKRILRACAPMKQAYR